MPRTIVIEETVEFIARHGGNPLWWVHPRTGKGCNLLPSGARVIPNSLGGPDQLAEPPGDDRERLELVAAYWQTRMDNARTDSQLIRFGRNDGTGMGWYDPNQLHFGRLLPRYGVNGLDKVASLKMLSDIATEAADKYTAAYLALQALGGTEKEARRKLDAGLAGLAARAHERLRQECADIPLIQTPAPLQPSNVPSNPPTPNPPTPNPTGCSSGGVPGRAVSVTPTGQPALT